MRCLALTAGLFMLGCSDARTPTEPTSSLTPAFGMASNTAKADHEALKQESRRNGTTSRP
jgi:hypothetical protein